MIIELGAVLAGIAVLLTAVIAALDARRTSSRALVASNAAMTASPMALFEGLRTEVRAVVDAYGDAVARWSAERDNMQNSLNGERRRADAAEAVVLMLRGEQAEMKIDLAAARAEVADLRARFETAIASRTTHSQS